MIQWQQWMRILVNNDLNYSMFLTEFLCSFYDVWKLQFCFIVTAWKNYSAQYSEFLLLIFTGKRNHWLIGKHASKKYIYTNNSLQFPAEMNSGSETSTTFGSFHTNYDYWGRLLINKDLFSCRFLVQYYVMNSKHFYHSAWFVNEYILTFASHICTAFLT